MEQEGITYIYIQLEFQKEEKKNKAEAIFEKLTAKYILKEKYILRYIIIKLGNSQNKKHIIKEARKKRQINFKGTIIKLQISST